MRKGSRRVGRAGRRGRTARPASARPRYLDELIFSPGRGELSAPNGTDLVVIDRKTLGNVFGSIRQMLHSGSDLIWYNAGRSAGEEEGERLKKLVAKLSPERFLQLICDLYTNLGWGKTAFDRLDLEGRSVSIVTKNNPLVRGVEAEEPVCHYIKGFYQGFCTAVFRSDRVTVEETSCEAAGGDRCEFAIRW